MEQPPPQPPAMQRARRRKLVVELLKSEVIGSALELARHLMLKHRLEVSEAIAASDIRAVGAIKVQLPGGGWRFRTPDMVTLDDVLFALSDRITADGLSVSTHGRDTVVVRTTKGTANSVAGIVKLLVDHELDDNVAYVLTDDDEYVVIALHGGAGDYVRRFRGWLK